jgi:Flp pilus assembly protein TadG
MSHLIDGIRDERGVTLVEFALVVPVVLLMLIACIDFARVVNASVTIQNASREGARYAALNPGVSTLAIRDHLAGTVLPLDAGLVTVGVTASTSTDPRCAAVAPTSCNWAAGQPAPTKTTVTVSYPWSATVWLIGPMLFAATRTSSLEATAAMEGIQ